ncbi:MAG: hypothetical protein AVDCRST_MAG18-2609 [uncultured Thermomicrobiales bacterium]|uniref:Uncharacterized protein n=1 Tax=uncultured Thermomicrobiales bacterium TaxID=1645740 RepID=A0A6J4VFL8_9BACT|nr:MAG: hypothetical protein AVDCRST_MAG18-2609 [uncultured Thermomicrobiales bacterium]
MHFNRSGRSPYHQQETKFPVHRLPGSPDDGKRSRAAAVY